MRAKKGMMAMAGFRSSPVFVMIPSLLTEKRNFPEFYENSKISVIMGLRESKRTVEGML